MTSDSTTLLGWYDTPDHDCINIHYRPAQAQNPAVFWTEIDYKYGGRSSITVGARRAREHWQLAKDKGILLRPFPGTEKASK